MKRGLIVGAIAGVMMIAGGFGAAAASAGPDNPQLSRPKAAASAAPAPDACLHLKQMNPAEQKYRNVNNVPFTYDSGKYTDKWFNVACGDTSFTVPRGQEAMVDLTAVAELDCQSPDNSGSWCGGRFLVNGLPVARPDNSNRGDTFAWDSANGGASDWQANTLAQVYRARCERVVNVTAPCTYRVQVQGQLANGANSLWVDDLTMSVDVTQGPVTVTTGATTP